MFKSKNTSNAPTDGVITSKGGLGKRTIVLIVVVVVIVLIGAAAAATYIGHIGPLAPKTDDTANNGGSTGSGSGTTKTPAQIANQAAVKEQQDQITNLVSSGDQQSVAKADAVADQGVAAANASGDDDYIVSASLTKAGLLIDTNRPQEALDDILLPLAQKYGSNDTYKDQINSYISGAYKNLGDQAKASEYASKISAVGNDQ